MAEPIPAAVALTRRKGTRRPTIATIPRRLARTRGLLGPTPRRAVPIRLLAAATAAEALLMPAVAVALHMPVVAEAPRTAAVVELPMVVVAVRTAIAKISKVLTFRKGPPLFNQAGLLLFCRAIPAIQSAVPQLSMRMRVKQVGQQGISKFDIAARSNPGNAAGRCYRKR